MLYVASAVHTASEGPRIFWSAGGITTISGAVLRHYWAASLRFSLKYLYSAPPPIVEDVIDGEDNPLVEE